MGKPKVSMTAEEMVAEYKNGKTIRQIGSEMGVSGAAITKHMKRIGFSTKTMSTKLPRTNWPRRKRQIYSDGIAPEIYQELLKSGVVRKYWGQRCGASSRGLEWEFTLATWWEIWQQSGKWELRGRKSGSYVMARHGDVGPYSPSNVEIITFDANARDSSLNRSIKRAQGLYHNPLVTKPCSTRNEPTMDMSFIQAQLQRRQYERQLSTVAKNSGVSRRTLYRIIAGKSNATFEILTTLDGYLKRTEHDKKLAVRNGGQ